MNISIYVYSAEMAFLLFIIFKTISSDEVRPVGKILIGLLGLIIFIGSCILVYYFPKELGLL